MGSSCYRNVLLEYGYKKEEIDQRVTDTFQEIFYGKERFYHSSQDDMGYLVDTGNLDVRTEGMSYGMMMCVQMDRKEEFDRIWKWARTYMYLSDGVNKGYFAWSVQPDGVRDSDGPAPDGEEYFAMALFFASHRWGDGTGIFHYSKEAQELLHTCVHKGEDGFGNALWEPSNPLICFVPGCGFTDPSYHLPHFYELFAKWAYEEDRPFWKKAAMASRDFLKKACHPDTGLSPEYSTYDGVPFGTGAEGFGKHDWYYSDAYRTIANIAMDYEWFVKNVEEEKEWYQKVAGNLQTFFCETMKENPRAVYSVDGKVIEEKALHPVAITAVNAQASLITKGKYAKRCVEEFWNTPLRTGNRRYYDNSLYMLALLALSGKYRIW